MLRPPFQVPRYGLFPTPLSSACGPRLPFDMHLVMWCGGHARTRRNAPLLHSARPRLPRAARLSIALWLEGECLVHWTTLQLAATTIARSCPPPENRASGVRALTLSRL